MMSCIKFKDMYNRSPGDFTELEQQEFYLHSVSCPRCKSFMDYESKRLSMSSDILSPTQVRDVCCLPDTFLRDFWR